VFVDGNVLQYNSEKQSRGVGVVGEFLKVMTYQNAQLLLHRNFPNPQTEEVSLRHSLHRRLSAPLTSPEDMPPFNRSTVDGYAVEASDTFGCSESLPSFLDLAGQVRMGTRPDFAVKKGQCCWIPTGGMLPEGTNAAVMVEYTEKLGTDTILVYKPVGPFENAMRQGEDVYKGQNLFSEGKRLRPQDIGLIASLGITRVPVYKPYNIGIISTGDEIIPVDKTPLTGQIRDVNSCALAAAVRQCGAEPAVYPIVPDHVEHLKQTAARALAENDVLLMSGGSSVGIMDVTLEVLLSFPDSSLLFHGVAVKPGKPTMAVKIGNKIVIGLPGHPVSALMMFYVVCAPLLRWGETNIVPARLTENLASQAGRDDFIPVELECGDQYRVARPLLGKSGLMSILARADGYLHIIREKQGLEAGDEVNVYLF
jgi:molybdopterin molybdotransferase